jgi:hypothetical protein
MMIDKKELIMRLKFVKEKNNNWYIDLPNWTGRHSALQMVAGADTMLEIMAEGRNEVLVFVTDEEFDGSNRLDLVKTCWFNGADYIIKTYEGTPLNLDVWLCNVTKFVLGDFPEKIYFAKLKQ